MVRHTFRTKLLSVVCALPSLAGMSDAAAAPLPNDSLIWMLQYEGSGTLNPLSVNVTAPSFANTYTSTLGNDIRAYGNLASGEVGTSVRAAGSSGQTIVSLFDTLEFETPGSVPVTVSYSAMFDGLLSSTSAFSRPYGQYRVSVYDITGLTNWLESVSFLGLWDQTKVVADATRVADTNIFLNIDAASGTTEFDEIQTGSFVADPSRRYGISITSNSFASDGGASDFLNTGTFRFTGLDGVTYTSGSGVFLSAVAEVPEPATLWLSFGAVLLLLGMQQRRWAQSEECKGVADRPIRWLPPAMPDSLHCVRKSSA